MAAIYTADVWCDDCVDLIRERLQSEGRAPEDPDDERSYDSDEYPKYMSDDEESDAPQHCASREECVNAVELPSGRKVGMLFGELTSDGVRYVREAALDGGEIPHMWAQHYIDSGYDLDLTPCPHCGAWVDTE